MGFFLSRRLKGIRGNWGKWEIVLGFSMGVEEVREEKGGFG